MHVKSYLVLCFAVFLQSQKADGISCLTCEWSSTFEMQFPECFDYSSTESTTIPSFECPYQDSANPYCQTKFLFYNGMLAQIERTCNAGTFDQDYSTNEMPPSDKCVADFDITSDNIDQTTCYYSCNNSDSCNDHNPGKLKLCEIDCGPNGSCDYITGKCDCRDGYTGVNCTIQSAPPRDVFRQCLQCNDEITESRCSGSVQATSCRDRNQKYCSVSKTTTFSSDGTTVREFITRGCTDSFRATDECYIGIPVEDDFTTDTEYTCVTTCDEDACNTGIPDGQISGEEPVQPIRCVVCNSDDTSVDCATKTSTTVCPSSASHCLSTVTYLTSEKQDLPYNAEPEYELMKVERSCSESFVTTTCNVDAVGGSSLKRVTCQESCQSEGCNTGWPARPLCSQCSCDQCTSNDPCVSNPPPATVCSQPYHAYCTIEDHNRETSGSSLPDGYPRSIKRSCSYRSIGNICTPNKYDSSVENCNKSCTSDECNLGFSPYYVPTTSGFSHLTPRNFLLAFLPSVFLTRVFN